MKKPPRKSKNVVDTRNVAKSIYDTKTRSHKRMKDQKGETLINPATMGSFDPYRVITKATLRGNGFKDPTPQSLTKKPTKRNPRGR